MLEFLKFLYEFLMPHYVTEKVAYVGDPEGKFSILCCADDLTEFDLYDGLATVKAVAWLFWGFNAKVFNFEPGAVYD